MANARPREVAGNPMTDVEIQIEIARVYKTSENKLPVFTYFIQNNKPLLERCIVFVETQEYGAAVLDIVHETSAGFSYVLFRRAVRNSPTVFAG